jgi:catechol 2,3-dioxygenase-like lactoylglutathione lyase family enzyme
MIQRMSHATIYVLDQESAKRFYTEKLGFEVRDDAKFGPYRWLTVGPKGQPDLRIVLFGIMKTPVLDEQKAAALRALVESGGLGCGVLETDDCQRDHEELKAKGVRFLSPPTQRPYGLEAIFADDSGNWWSLGQRNV